MCNSKIVNKNEKNTTVSNIDTIIQNSVKNYLKEQLNKKEILKSYTSQIQSTKKYISYDGDTMIINKNGTDRIYVPKAGIILFDHSFQKVLLIKTEWYTDDKILNCKWGLPKGHKNNDESLMECAIRETYEETGLNIIINNTHPSIKVKNTTYFIYVLDKNESSIFTPKDKKEITECVFVPLSYLNNLDLNQEACILLKNKLKICIKNATKLVKV